MALQPAEQHDRSSTEYHKQLGNILYKQDALASAVQEWLQAGEEPLTLNNLGTAYDGLGDLEKAAQYYQRACTDPQTAARLTGMSSSPSGWTRAIRDILSVTSVH